MSERKKVLVLLLTFWVLACSIGWAQSTVEPSLNWPEYQPVKMKAFASRYYMRSTLNWEKLPPHLPFVSNKFIPGNLDLGSKYVEERFGLIQYASPQLKLDRVDSVSTAGTLRQFQWLQIYELFLDLNEIHWTYNQTTPAPFFNPFHPKNRHRFYFKLLLDGSVSFSPKKENSNNVSGTIHYQDSLNYTLQLYLDKSDRVRLADSVFVQMEVKEGIPLSGRLVFAIDIPFFKGWNIMEWHMLEEARDYIPTTSPSFQEWENEFDSLRLKDKWRPIPLDSAQKFSIDEQSYYNTVRPDERSTLIQRATWLQPFITSTRVEVRENNYLEFPALWRGLGINTVEGAYYLFKPEWHAKTTSGEIEVAANLRYAFGENQFRWLGQFQYKSLNRTRRIFEIQAGRYLRQFNELNPISPFYNSFYTVFTGDNFLKMFEQDFVRMKFEFEPFLGFRFSSFIEYSERSALFNLDQFVGKRDFTPNNLDYPNVINPTTGFERHQANTFGLELSYQVGQRYRMQRNKRIDIQSNWPKFYIDFKKGIKLLNGVTDFDFVDLGITDKTDWGRWGLTEMDISVGSFMNSNRVEFPDFHHFNGIQNIFLQPTSNTWSNIRQFSTLPYYDYSTATNYLEVHIKHNFRQPIIANLLNKTGMNWSTYIGWNFLHTSDRFDYSEYYVGIEDIFEILSVQFVYTTPQLPSARSSIRIGINIDYSYYRDYHR